MADEEAAPAVNEEEVKDEGNAAPDDGDSGDDDGASDGADEADGEKRIDLSLGMNLEGLSKSALKKLKRKEGKIALEKEARCPARVHCTFDLLRTSLVPRVARICPLPRSLGP